MYDSSASKTKVPTSVLPWKTKWKPSPEDKKYAIGYIRVKKEKVN